MPSIELEGHSEAKFALVDGKIVRLDQSRMAMQPPSSFELRAPE